MLGLLLSIAGFLGDLLFSAAKRYLKIKDFSQLIPGHGGILDRVDSLVLTAPVLYFWLTLTL
jgi:phosphatidate cytidylyltransferase